MPLLDLSITYSLGGKSEAEPLLRRVVPFSVEFEEEPSHIQIQEALLERTDLLLADLCHVFDENYDAFEVSSFRNLENLTVLMGACSHAVNNILSWGPSVKYAYMFFRVQKLLNLKEDIAKNVGLSSAKTMETFVLPLWSTLRQIDETFKQEKE